MNISKNLNLRIVSLETNHSLLRHYGRRSNVEITAIHNTLIQKGLESKIVQLLFAVGGLTILKRFTEWASFTIILRKLSDLLIEMLKTVSCAKSKLFVPLTYLALV